MFQKIKNIFHLFQAIIANIFYCFPSRKIKIIGVTGTDGKTTTTTLIAHILKSSGKKISYISTVKAQIAGKEYDTGLHVTTPSAFMIQKFLSQSVKNKDEYFILETTSHALDQYRVWGVKYEIGVLTNVTPEHLDYHQSYEEYVKVKEQLLKMARIGVLNTSDISYLLLSQKSKVKSQNYNSKVKIIDGFSSLTAFNKLNYLAAYKVCQILGLSDKQITEGMKTFKLPKGRFDLVYDKEFKIIIDFAHTPNAFKVLLPAIREKYLKEGGRLIHIFGSAGLRDRLKRSLMGKISDQFADYIILTEEDYRTESLDKICLEIAKGIKKTPFLIIKNRQDAINKGVAMAVKGDVVVITGKAHEKSLCRGKTEHPWDEYQAVEIGIKYKIKK